MEYLQYYEIRGVKISSIKSFKPYYKWNTFNTEKSCNGGGYHQPF